MQSLDNSYNDYYTLHHLALNYKAGDEESGILLVNRFALFLQNYSKLFSTGLLELNNVSLKAFALFFNTHKINNRFMYIYKKYNIPVDNKISTFFLLRQIITIEDFNQELILALLDMAKSYKGNTVSFHTYVSRMYHYILLGRLKKELKNVGINGNVMEIKDCIDNDFEVQLDMRLEDISNQIENSSHRLHIEYTSVYNDDYINDNWVLGNFKDSLFSKLSNSERELVKLFYVDKLTDSEIADKYGLCRATINRRRQKILNTLRERI